jgi:hypothetical protein
MHPIMLFVIVAALAALITIMQRQREAPTKA